MKQHLLSIIPTIPTTNLKKERQKILLPQRKLLLL